MKVPLKTLLSVGYAAGTKVHRALYESQLLRSYQLETPVIGIGNVQCGGTGKTPTTCDLARRFLSEGQSVCVVVSGYKKEGRSPLAIQSCAEVVDWQAAARDLGDEGAEILFELKGQPKARVIAARAKWKGVAWSQQAFAPDVILVDDALQHYPLRCHKMLILATRPQDILQDTWLPKGRLREKRMPSPQDENRNQQWVWTHVSDADVNEQAVCWQREITEVIDWRTGQSQPVRAFRGKSVNCLTGIAHPEQFVKSCQDLGIEVASVHSFSDHHSFTETEIKKLVGSVTASADWWVTVKDAVKMDSSWFFPGKLWAVRSSIQWNENFFQTVWPWLKTGPKEGGCES